MNRWMTALLLVLVSGSAFANSLNVHNTITNDFTPPVSDYSVAYLSQIFGNVGNVLHGMSGQILGKMFEVLSKGIVVVSALFMAYTVFTMVARYVIEGTQQHIGPKTIFVLVRIAFGFALIIPSSVTGYSILQDMFMRVVVAGVGLADSTWDVALRYMSYGGGLYIRPSNLKNDQDYISKALGSSTSPGYAAQILRAETCMYASNYSKPIYHAPVSYADASVTSGATTNQIGGYITFPDNCGSVQSYFDTQVDNQESGTADNKSANKAGFNTHNYSSAQLMNFQDISYSALQTLVNKLLPVAKARVNNAGMSDITLNNQVFSALSSYAGLMATYQHAFGIHNRANTALAQAKINFANAIANCNTNNQQNGNLLPVVSTDSSVAQIQASCGDSVVQMKAAAAESVSQYSSQIVHSDKLPFITQASEEGWIMAGRFYWAIEQANNASAAISISNLKPGFTEPTGTTNWSDPKVTAFMKTGTDQSATNLSPFFTTISSPAPTFQTCSETNSSGTSGAHVACIGQLWAQYLGAQQNSIEGGANGNFGGTSWAGAVMSGALNKVVGGMAEFHSKNGYNPIAVLMRVGNDLLNAVVAIWIVSIALTIGIAIGAGICNSTSPGGVIFKGVLTWLKMIIGIVSGALLVPGTILAYYVPMFPFAVFTFAAVGWIIMVIEGMAAAPLVCMGLTHPEGHDFLGKAEQALMLFLGIFLRPALMIVGLIASMILSFVAFHMLIVGFSGVLVDLQQAGSSAFSNGFLVLISVVMVMVIFGFMTMELIEQCFKVTYQLPNNIMRWIGGPQMGEEYGQMASAIKGAVSSGGSQIGQAASEGGRANDGLTRDIGKTKQLSDKKKAAEERAKIKTGKNNKPADDDPKK